MTELVATATGLMVDPAKCWPDHETGAWHMVADVRHHPESVIVSRCALCGGRHVYPMTESGAFGWRMSLCGRPLRFHLEPSPWTGHHLVALHEAGHAVVAAHFGFPLVGARIDTVTLGESAYSNYGHAEFSVAVDARSRTVARKIMACLMAGRAAEVRADLAEAGEPDPWDGPRGECDLGYIDDVLAIVEPPFSSAQHHKELTRAYSLARSILTQRWRATRDIATALIEAMARGEFVSGAHMQTIFDRAGIDTTSENNLCP